MKAWVGVTDGDWFDHVRTIGAREVNFWQPNAQRTFAAIPRGAPFLFKTHYRRGNALVGGGFFSGWATLPVRLAWEIFGESNGAASLAGMIESIAGYRNDRTSFDGWSLIGCIVVSDVRYFADGVGRPAPVDWSPNLVRGKSYDLTSPVGSYVESVFEELLAQPEPAEIASLAIDWAPTVVPGPVFSGTREVPVRVGQPAFKALVHAAYERRCAVTGDRVVPVLEAAHIRPISREGGNRVDNGLLLRSDVHTLFDRGYLGVHPHRRSLMVSPRLRSEWGNGDEFYALERAGETIRLPTRKSDRPSAEFLTWHADEVYQSA